jgi:hypothetical protein
MKKIFTRNIIILAVVLFGFSLPGVVFSKECPYPEEGEKMVKCEKYNLYPTKKLSDEYCLSIEKDAEAKFSDLGFMSAGTLFVGEESRVVSGYGSQSSMQTTFKEINISQGVPFSKEQKIKYTVARVDVNFSIICEVVYSVEEGANAFIRQKENYDQCIILVGKKHTQCTPVWNKKKEGIALSTDEETILLNCNQIHKSCMGPGGQEAFSQRGDISRDDFEKPEGYTGILPDCAFTYDGCRDINEVVLLGINVGKMIFSLIGTVAFVMFMYGGITMITSFGNAEKFKQGQGILVAAVVGIIISLGAYLLVDTILDALGVAKDFRVIG